jgi:hypothetical protein
MKNHFIPIITILIAILCVTSIATAQVTAQFGGVTQGMFGARTIGRPNNGMQMTGMFGNRTIGRPRGFQPMDFSGLLQPTLGQFDPNAALQLNSLVSAQNQTLAPRYAISELQSEPGVVQVAPGETNGMEGAVPADRNLGTPLGAETTVQPAAANLIGPRIRMRAGFTPPTRPQAFIRSEELSRRLTSIARSKGMLTGSDIDVYLSEGVAIVQGKVRSPGDRTLLANVLSLNPDVGQIDNRLVVQQSGSMR